MFQSILVPLDGSARAEAAVPVAARIAHASGGNITLLRVLGGTEFLPYIFAGLEPSTYSADIETANSYVQAVAQLPDLSDITVRTEVHSGSAAAMILNRARANAADLLVLTSHGHSGLVGWALGSVSSKVARQATVPVFVLRESEDDPGATAPSTARPTIVLVALDGSSIAESSLPTALELVAALAGGGPSQLHLLHVVPPSAVQDRHEATVEVAKDYLRGVAERLKTGLAADAPFAVTWSVGQGDDVAEAIIQAASGGENAEGTGPGERCAAIVLSTAGQGGTEAGNLGGVAERVLNETPLPLLLVHPPTEAKAEGDTAEKN